MQLASVPKLLTCSGGACTRLGQGLREGAFVRWNCKRMDLWKGVGAPHALAKRQATWVSISLDDQVKGEELFQMFGATQAIEKR